jgi:hypothetical protein
MTLRNVLLNIVIGHHELLQTFLIPTGLESVLTYGTTDSRFLTTLFEWGMADFFSYVCHS